MASGAAAVETHSRNWRPKPSSISSSDLLRRRLNQAEQQLREAEEKYQRETDRQKRDLDEKIHEHDKLRAEVEEIRLSECNAIVYTKNATNERVTPYIGGRCGYRSSSKLLASSTQKYRNARAEVERKRAQCAEVEAKLASTLLKLNDIRREKESLRLSASRVKSPMREEIIEVGRQELSRKHLKGLETHVENALDKFNELASEAQGLRKEIDSLLVSQSAFESLYRKQEHILFEKKKEISFLVEVCNLLSEERNNNLAKLQALKDNSVEENGKYESAFEELAAVSQTNQAHRDAVQGKVVALNAKIDEIRRRRQELELEVSEDSCGNITDNRNSRASGFMGKYGLGGGNSANQSEGQGDGANALEGTVRNQIKEFDSYYSTLCSIVGSDDMDDVVNFIEACSQNRYSLFEEINHIDDEIAKIESQYHSLEKEILDHTRHPPSAVTPEDHISQLTHDLMSLERETIEEMERYNTTSAILKESLVYIERMFKGLCCNPDPIYEIRGTTSISLLNVRNFICAIEQRTEEFLIALARRTQSTDLPSGIEERAISTIADTVIARPSLPTKGENSADSILRNNASLFPRSADIFDGEEDRIDHPLSTDELKKNVLERMAHSRRGRDR